MGPIDQPDFINTVAEVETKRSAAGLLQLIHDIELAMGRVRDRRWGPRTIDVDILLFGTEVIDEPGLCIPHPGLRTRGFVLAPLRDLAPDLVIPGLEQPVSALCEGTELNVQRLDSAFVLDRGA